MLEENGWVGRGWGKYTDKVGGNESRHSYQRWETHQREEKASGLGLREELCKTAGREVPRFRIKVRRGDKDVLETSRNSLTHRPPYLMLA